MDNFTTSESLDLEKGNEQENDLAHVDAVRATWITMTSLLIFTFGMLGNVTTVYIYTRSKKLRQNNMFELILAAFDIFALFVLLPIFTLDLYNNVGLSVQFSLAISVCGHSYYITILCCTICRYVAVYHPFTFKVFIEKWRMRFVAIICFATVAVFCRTFLLRIIINVKFSWVYFIDILLLTSFCFASIFVLFILIIAKLMKQNQVGEQGSSGQSGGARKKHVVAIKTFGAVSLCFLTSYITAYLVRNGFMPIYADFLYFLNHICNPVIYLFFNREFRAKAREIFRRDFTE